MAAVAVAPSDGPRVNRSPKLDRRAPYDAAARHQQSLIDDPRVILAREASRVVDDLVEINCRGASLLAPPRGGWSIHDDGSTMRHTVNRSLHPADRTSNARARSWRIVQSRTSVAEGVIR